MVGVERLPGHLREQVLNFQIRVSGEELTANIDYILASGHEALLGTMSWMQVLRLQETELLTAPQATAEVNWQHAVHCFCGPAGSGKSHSMAAKAAQRAQLPVTMTIGERTSAADVIASLVKASAQSTAATHIQLSVSSYASFSWLNQLFYQLLVEGVITDPATGAVFAFLPGVTASIDVEIPKAVPGESAQQATPDFAAMYPLLADERYGMMLHLPVLADLVYSRATNCLTVTDPDSQ